MEISSYLNTENSGSMSTLTISTPEVFMPWNLKSSLLLLMESWPFLVLDFTLEPWELTSKSSPLLDLPGKAYKLLLTSGYRRSNTPWLLTPSTIRLLSTSVWVTCSQKPLPSPITTPTTTNPESSSTKNSREWTKLVTSSLPISKT